MAPAQVTQPPQHVKQRAHEVHLEMRGYWTLKYHGAYDPKLFDILGRLLFMKIKTAEPAEDDSAGAPQPGSEDVRAFASKADTFRAILDVLQLRQTYLQRGEHKTNLGRCFLGDAWKQRNCGSKQIWEILAFTGRMDPNFLRATLQEDVDGQVAEEDVD